MSSSLAHAVSPGYPANYHVGFGGAEVPEFACPAAGFAADTSY